MLYPPVEIKNFIYQTRKGSTYVYYKAINHVNVKLENLSHCVKAWQILNQNSKIHIYML